MPEDGYFASDIVIEVSGNVDCGGTFYVPAMAEGHTFTVKSAGTEVYTISNAYFCVNAGADLILENIILDGGGSNASAYSVIEVSDSSNGYFQPSSAPTESTVTLGEGAVIQNGRNDFYAHGIIDLTSSSGYTPKLIMQDGSKISGGYRGVWMDASWGGNVEFEMTGGSITKNGDGGGVLVGSNTKFTMTGGSIMNNTGTLYGNGGISVNGGTLIIGGDAKVYNNGVGGSIKLFDWNHTFMVQENFTGMVGVTSSSSISGTGKNQLPLQEAQIIRRLI